MGCALSMTEAAYPLECRTKNNLIYFVGITANYLLNFLCAQSVIRASCTCVSLCVHVHVFVCVCMSVCVCVCLCVHEREREMGLIWNKYDKYANG